MHISIGRRTRLTALGAGVISAAAIALSAAAPAVADTADTGGTAALSVPRAVVVGLAKSTIIMLPGSPGSAGYGSGAETFSMPVTGGTGEVSNFTGVVDLGGTLIVINSKAGHTVNITDLQLNLFTGALTGVLPGGTAHTALAYLNGDLSTSSDPGPPATESVSSTEVDMSAKLARALNTALNAKAFVKGTNLGAFTATFDVTIT
ncbi:MAG: hypothetical protein ACTHJW_08875 [Streptosporangiaceae bacterium]